MKLLFLGTAAAEAVPAPFCNCDTCNLARLDKKYARNRASLLINSDLLIDCGPDFVSSCTNYNVNAGNITTILITHAHFDHWYPENLEIRHKRYIKTPMSAINLVGNSSVFYKLTQLGYKDDDLKINRIEARAYKSVKINHYTVTPIYANHAHEFGAAMNYVIRNENQIILYASDTGFYDEETFKFLNNVHLDALILDGTNLLSTTSKNHLNLEGVIQMINTFKEGLTVDKSTKIIITHFSHTGIVCDDLINQNLQEKYSLLFAYDGMEVTI